MGGTRLLERESTPSLSNKATEGVTTESVANALLEMEATRQKHANVPWVPDEVTANTLAEMGEDEFKSRVPELTSVGLQNLDCLLRSLEGSPENEQSNLPDLFVLTQEEMARRALDQLDSVSCPSCGQTSSIHDTTKFGVLGTIIGEGETVWCFECNSALEIQFDSSFAPIGSEPARQTPTPGAARTSGNPARGLGIVKLPALAEALSTLESATAASTTPAAYFRDDSLNSAGWALGTFASWIPLSSSEVSLAASQLSECLHSDIAASRQMLELTGQAIREVHVARAWPSRAEQVRELSSSEDDRQLPVDLGTFVREIGDYGSSWNSAAASILFDSRTAQSGGDGPFPGEIDLLAGLIQSGYAISLRGPASERES